MLPHYTKAYWESISLVNLKAIYLGISKVTQFHVWRMIKRKYCGIFHGIWKNAPETVPTDMSVLDKMNKKWYIMDGTVCVSYKLYIQIYLLTTGSLANAIQDFLLAKLLWYMSQYTIIYKYKSVLTSLNLKGH